MELSSDKLLDSYIYVYYYTNVHLLYRTLEGNIPCTPPFPTALKNSPGLSPCSAPATSSCASVWDCSPA